MHCCMFELLSHVLGSSAVQTDQFNQIWYPDLPEEVFTAIERQGKATQIPEDEEVQHDSAQAELLAWHYSLGHAPFAKIK
jgi:hypothetical protein